MTMMMMVMAKRVFILVMMTTVMGRVGALLKLVVLRTSGGNTRRQGRRLALQGEQRHGIARLVSTINYIESN